MRIRVDSPRGESVHVDVERLTRRAENASQPRRNAMTPKPEASPEATVDALIRSLGFEATEERQSDRLDFHEVHVTALRSALEKAWAAGAASARSTQK
jgi:hypothetical protein